MRQNFRHTEEAKRRIGNGAKGRGRGGFNTKTKCPDCRSVMSAANLSIHAPACEKTKNLVPVFGYRPTTAELKVFERCLRAYGITTESYLMMLQIQDFKCAICCRDIKGVVANRRLAFIDHDHNTGAVRGLLCSLCNIVLGAVDDNHEVLLRASTYLLRDQEGCG